MPDVRNCFIEQLPHLKSYDRPEDITTAGLYRDTASVNDTLAADTANFGNLPGESVHRPAAADTYRASTHQQR